MAAKKENLTREKKKIRLDLNSPPPFVMKSYGGRGRPRNIIISQDKFKSDRNDCGSSEVPEMRNQDREIVNHADAPVTYLGPTDLFETVECSAQSARKAQDKERWAELRPKLMKVRHGTLAPEQNQPCSSCHKKISSSIIRCQDCGPDIFYCQSCSDIFHAVLQFHALFIWKDDFMYEPLPQKPLLTQNSCNLCDNSHVVITVFNDKGLPVETRVRTCSHEELALTLLRNGLWPASPVNPKVAFSLRLMELCCCMQLHGCMSIQAFSTSILQMECLMGIQNLPAVSSLYRNLLGAVNEYRFHRSRMMTEALEDGDLHSCGICRMDPSRSVVALDGNFGLVHKRRVGGLEKARHNGLFFHEDEKVQEFVRKWSSEGHIDKNECSEFQAGDAVRSKNRTKKLDITGIFGSVCQHEFPGKMINLHHGERLSYPAFVLTQLLLDRTDDGKKQLIMYDIGCKMAKHLEKKGSDLAKAFRFAVPAFHRYAHGLDCQLTFGQRCTAGAALHDGEGMERVWAYLRKFAAPSKQMSLANREDLLTDALLAYSKRSFCHLATKLVTQANSASVLKEKSLKEFQDVEKEMSKPDSCSQDWLQSWQREVLDSKENKGGERITPWQEYCYNILRITEIKSSSDRATDAVSKAPYEVEIQRLQMEILKLKQIHKFAASQSIPEEQIQSNFRSVREHLTKNCLKTAVSLAKERVFLRHQLTKYADGQKIAIRVSKRLQKNSKDVSQVQVKLKDLGMDISTAQLMNIDSEIYKDVTVGTTPQMQKAALSFANFQRACEAEAEAKTDMKLLLLSLIDKGFILSSKMKPEPDNAVMKGVRHLISVRLMVLGIIHADCVSKFSPYISVENLNTMPMPTKMTLKTDVSLNFGDLELEEVVHPSNVDSDLEDVDSDLEDVDIEDVHRVIDV